MSVRRNTPEVSLGMQRAGGHTHKSHTSAQRHFPSHTTTKGHSGQTHLCLTAAFRTASISMGKITQNCTDEPSLGILQLTGQGRLSVRKGLFECGTAVRVTSELSEWGENSQQVTAIGSPWIWTFTRFLQETKRSSLGQLVLVP